jgi:hypothetical protein
MRLDERLLKEALLPARQRQQPHPPPSRAAPVSKKPRASQLAEVNQFSGSRVALPTPRTAGRGHLRLLEVGGEVAFARPGHVYLVAWCGEIGSVPLYAAPSAAVSVRRGVVRKTGRLLPVHGPRQPYTSQTAHRRRTLCCGP